MEQRLRDLYTSFNARDADGVLAFCAGDVDWPNAWEGGRVVGHDAVRDYWSRQWAAIDPTVEPEAIVARPDGSLAVDVHQTVRDLSGAVVADARIVHVYELREGLVVRMTVEHPPREVTTDLDVLQRLIELEGREVLDVGCGDGTLVRELESRGARAVGLEITEEQLGGARAHGIGRFVVGRAEALPLDDDSVDAVMFMRSLHHVPPEAMIPALADAHRVLRPGGAVYVAEPLAEGDFYELVSIVDDETEVRAAAQRAIADAARAGLEHAATVEYAVQGLTSGIAALRRRVVGVDPARAEIFDARKPQLAEAFARLGTPVPGGRMFTAPMRADVLRAA